MIPVGRYWRMLKRYLRRRRARMALLGALLLTGIAFQLINPQLIRWFIDGALAGDDGDRLTRLALGFTALAVGHQVLSVVSTWLAENIAWAATNELRGDLAAHLLDLDMGFHKSHTPGELIERVDGDVTALSNFFSQFSIHVVGNMVLLAGIIALLLAENLWIGLGVALFAGAALLAMMRIQGVAVRFWTEVKALRAEFFGFLGEQLQGTEDIRGNGAERDVLNRFTRILRRWLPASIRARLGHVALWSTNVVVFAVGNSLVYWLGSLLFGNGALSLGSVYLVFHYTEMLRYPLDRIREQMEDLQKAGAGMARIEELQGIESRLDTGGSARLPEGPLDVVFDEMSFGYEDDIDTLVLKDIHLRIGAGRVVGVLGRTGSGKTTLARLLTRLYDPTLGTLTISGVDLRTAEIGELRRRVGLVTQDVHLFRASIRDNLTFFDPTVTDERIRTALDALGLATWVEAMPAGLDTVLEAGGAGLSAGEAQLLAFTRIFLEESGIVILDEASSRLDPATEALIERAVDRLLRDRTGVIIAHRLDTVRRADDILILEDGRVVEFGERKRLEDDPDSRFSRLLAVGLEEVLR